MEYEPNGEILFNPFHPENPVFTKEDRIFRILWIQQDFAPAFFPLSITPGLFLGDGDGLLDVVVKQGNFSVGLVDDSVEQGAFPVRQGASSVEQGASSVEQGASSVEQGASSVEQGTSSMEQGTSSGEQGASPGEDGYSSGEAGCFSGEAGYSSGEAACLNGEGCYCAGEGGFSAETITRLSFELGFSSGNMALSVITLTNLGGFFYVSHV